MTPEQIEEIRTRAESFSGLQYVVPGSPIGWPWTSAPSTNQIVDLVRVIPDLLARIDALTAERDAAKRLSAFTAKRYVGLLEQLAPIESERDQARAERDVLEVSLAEHRAVLIAERDELLPIPPEGFQVTHEWARQMMAGYRDRFDRIEERKQAILASQPAERGADLLASLNGLLGALQGPWVASPFSERPERYYTVQAEDVDRCRALAAVPPAPDEDGRGGEGRCE